MGKDIYKSAELGELRLEILHMENAESPREWENLSIMVCFHRDYKLGDEHDYNSKEFDSWDELKRKIMNDHEPVVIKPVYLYDHSGQTISTSPFNCRFDSGQVGFIFVPEQRCINEYGNTSDESIKRATEVLDGEFETYKHYVEGEVYGFRLLEKKFCTCKEHFDWSEVDSCWGFYGSDFEKNGVADYMLGENEEHNKEINELIKNLK